MFKYNLAVWVLDLISGWRQDAFWCILTLCFVNDSTFWTPYLGSLCGKGTAFGLQYDRTELGCQIVNKQQFVCKNGVSAKVCFFCRESSLTRVGVFGSPCHCFFALQHSITEGIAYCFVFFKRRLHKREKIYHPCRTRALRLYFFYKWTRPKKR